MSYDEQERSTHGGAPVELYRFASGSEVWSWTSGDAEEIYAGANYEPEAITRGEVDQNGEDDQGQLEVTVPRTNPVAELFVAGLPSRPVTVEVFRFHRGDPEVISIFRGEVASADFLGSEVKLTCLPPIACLRSLGPPNTFQGQCNWALYSSGCGLDHENYRVTGDISAIEGLTIRSPAFGSHPDPYFAGGWVENAAGEMQWVTSHVGATLTLLTAFRDLRLGDHVSAFPGCARTLEACEAFDNLQHFLGFPFLPSKNPFDVGVG
jgi:uncharacterized phage protein (TIGR02218 family)